MIKSRLEIIRSEIRRLDDLDDELESLRRQGGNVRCRDLERVAESLGFSQKKKRTGEPTWQREGGYTVAIPCHSKTLGKGLGIKICKHLQSVVFDLRSSLQDEEAKIKKQKNQLGNGKHHEY